MEYYQSSQVKSSQVKSSQVKSSQVKSSQVKSSQVKSSQVKSSQVKSSQVKSSQVKDLFDNTQKKYRVFALSLFEIFPRQRKEKVKQVYWSVPIVDDVLK